MDNKTVLILLIVGYLILNKGGLSGCQKSESVLSVPSKQNSIETPYTTQRSDDASKQRANSTTRDSFWNNFWHQQTVGNVNQQKALRDLFRQQGVDAEYKARQMVIDKRLQDFQNRLNNPKKKKWWQ